MNSEPLTSIADLDYDALYREAKTIIDGVPQWAHAKHQAFPSAPANFDVDCYTSRFNSDFWAARHSTLSTQLADAYAHKFHKYLLGSLNDPQTSHTAYEKEYIHEIYDFEVKFVKSSPTVAAYLTKAFYKLQFPLKRRVFYELLLLYKVDSDFLIISLPVEPSVYGDPAKDFVHATYVSVEQVKSNPDGTLSWTMCTASKAGGFVPDWLTNSMLAGAVIKDVPSFLEWAKSQD